MNKNINTNSKNSKSKKIFEKKSFILNRLSELLSGMLKIFNIIEENDAIKIIANIDPGKIFFIKITNKFKEIFLFSAPIICKISINL